MIRRFLRWRMWRAIRARSSTESLSVLCPVMVSFLVGSRKARELLFNWYIDDYVEHLVDATANAGKRRNVVLANLTQLYRDYRSASTPAARVEAFIYLVEYSDSFKDSYVIAPTDVLFDLLRKAIK